MFFFIERSIIMSDGRGRSLQSSTFTNARVAGPLTYYPGFTREDGKQINPRVKIPVYMNYKTGAELFTLLVWGKLADACCRWLPKGRAIDIVGEAHSAKVNIYGGPSENFALICDPTGKPRMKMDVSFTVEKIAFGEESPKEIERQVNKQHGNVGPRAMWEWRPRGWNQEGTQAATTYGKIIEDRAKAVYVPGQKMFGYAEVRERRGGTAQVQAAAGQQAYQPSTTESMVQHAVDTQPDQAYAPSAPQGPAQQYTPSAPAQDAMVY
jgi:hypothetical protein